MITRAADAGRAWRQTGALQDGAQAGGGGVLSAAAAAPMTVMPI